MSGPALVATFGLLVVVAIRAVILFVPGFGTEFGGASWGPAISFGPSAAAVTNTIGIFVLALAVLDAVRQGRRVHWILVTCWGAGLPFWFFHARGDAESLRIGGDWAGTLALGLAALHLASQAWARRACLAVAVALIIPLAADGLYQFANHGKTVELYEKQKDELLRSRGWRVGSPMARKYEARLYQFEASGRMSFSNVYGSVMMGLMLVSLGAALAVKAAPAAARRGVLLVPTLAALAVYLSHSKGALVAGMACAAAVAVAWGLSRRLGGSGWMWRSVGPVVVVCGLAGVLLRGAAGPPDSPVGERSLLFRSFYWSAAWRMWQKDPITGVGPGRFRDRYLLTKNPLSPEDVSDPHNVFVSYISTLGLGGLAWSIIPLALVIRAGAGVDVRLRAARAPPEFETTASKTRPAWPLAAAVGVVVFAVQFLVSFHFLSDPAVWGLLAVCLVLVGLGFRVVAEGLSRARQSEARSVGPVDRAVGVGMMVAAVGMCLVMLPPLGTWLGGALGFGAVSFAVVRWGNLESPAVALALMVAAAVILLHSQIEMTLVNTMSAPLLAVLLGVAAARDQALMRPRSALFNRVAAGAAAVGVVALVGWYAVPQVRQQSLLAEARRQGRTGQLDRAARTLQRAREAWPGDGRLGVEEARLWIIQAGAYHRERRLPERDGAVGAALRTLEASRALGSQLSRNWREESLTSQQMWRWTQDRRWLDRSCEAAEKSIEHAPLGLMERLHAADCAYTADRLERAQSHYQRVIELDRLAYLEPNSRLDGADRARVLRRLDGLANPEAESTPDGGR